MNRIPRFMNNRVDRTYCATINWCIWCMCFDKIDNLTNRFHYSSTPIVQHILSFQTSGIPPHSIRRFWTRSFY